MYPQSNVAKMWNRSTKNWFGPSAASITVNFMPMSHVMGRGILYGTLGNGGTAYFAAKSDLSTLLEDLAPGAADRVELRPAHLGDAVRRVPERGGPTDIRRRRP